MTMRLLPAWLAQGMTEVCCHRTPGKPMMFHEKGKPAEEIAARKDGETFVLLVRVNVPRKGVEKCAEEEAELSKEEWESLEKIVGDGTLLEWEPKNQRVAHDWGEARFSILGKKNNRQTWTGEPDDAAAPLALSKRLAKLAKEKIEKRPLCYLTP